MEFVCEWINGGPISLVSRMHCKIDICTLSFKLSIKRNFVICYVVIPFESLTWIIERGA
jgi:hypothetical protein